MSFEGDLLKNLAPQIHRNDFEAHRAEMDEMLDELAEAREAEKAEEARPPSAFGGA